MQVTLTNFPTLGLYVKFGLDRITVYSEFGLERLNYWGITI